MMDSPTPAQVAFAQNVEHIYGPSMFGNFLGLMLYGVSVTQFYLYYKQFGRRDSSWLMTFASICFILGSAIIVLDVVHLCKALVQHVGQETILMDRGLEFAISRILMGVFDFLVQSFFAWLLANLTKSNKLGLAITVMAFVSLASSVTAGVFLVIDGVPAESGFKINMLISLIVSACCDAVITGVLLVRVKERTAVASNIVLRLLRIVASTALLATLCAITEAALYIVLGNNSQIHVTFQPLVTYLYLNALFSCLNARTSAGDADFVNNGAKSKSFNGAEREGRMKQQNTSQTPVVIRVDHATIFVSEDEKPETA